MKTPYFTLLAALVAICCGQSLQAQYPIQGTQGMMPAQPMLMPINQPGMMPGMMPGMQPGAMMGPGMAQQQMMGGPMMGSQVLGAQLMAPQASFIPASPAFAPPSQVVPASAFGGGGGGGGKGCSSCGGKGGKCCTPLGWDNNVTFYGEFLYLRVRDAEVPWGVVINSNPQDPPIQVSPLAVADFDYQPGFRFGVAKCLNECTRISAEYTMWEAGSSDAIQRFGGNVVRNLAEHPSTTNAATDSDNGTAQYDMSLDIVDVALQRAFYYDNDIYLSWVLGVRAAQLEQQFNASTFGMIDRVIDTDIDFNGVGVRFGLDGEFAINCQWSAYGKLFGAIVPGQFSTTYTQVDNAGPTPVVATGWDAGRIVTMWDLELGVARVSRCKNYRFSAGYTFSAWANVVQTDEWIRGVQTNSFVGMSDTTTFDGLVARFEARY